MAKKKIADMTFRANVDGFSEQFTEDVTVVDDDHPAVKEYPERFKPYRESRPDVEEATASPGSKRGDKS